MKTSPSLEDNKIKAESAETLLQLAIEAADLGTWDFNPVTGTIACSFRTNVFFGLPSSEAPLIMALSGVIEKDRQRVTDALQQALLPESGGRFDEDFTVANLQDGRKSRIRVKGQAFFNEEGKACRMTGVALDITKKRKLKELLEHEIESRTQELSLANLLLVQTNQTFEHAEQIGKFGSYAYQFGTGKISYSDNLYRLLGCEPGEFQPGQSFYNFVHPDDMEFLLKSREAAFERRELSRWEYRLIRKDGQVIWIRGSGKVVTDEDGSQRLIGTLQDITEEKNRETELRRQKEFVEALLDSSVDLILVFDREERIILVNKKVEELYRLPREKFLGKNISELYPNARSVYPDMEKALQGEYVHLPMYRSQLSGRIYEVFLVPLLNNGEVDGVLAIAHDHTSFLETKEKLEAIEEKNRELEQFAYYASHDLQEPLNTIASFTDLLETEHLLDLTAKEYIGFIKDSAARLANLINDLLEHSKIGRQGEEEMVDFNQVLREVMSGLQAAIAATNARIHVGELPVMKAYPAEIRLLFQNFLSNAIKFQQPGATPEVRITAEPVEDSWHFMVEDNGIGIEDKFKERVFVIFRRLHTSSEYEGTGIGLAHCKKIIDLHGGRLWLESEPGKGSRFHFTIPKK